MYSLLLPCLYCILWFSIWGGVSLRQHRQALELEALGENNYNDSTKFKTPNSEFCYDVPQTNHSISFENHLPGVTPVCKFDEANFEDTAYKMFYSFSYPESFGGVGLGPTFSVIYIFTLAVYFASSSDSGSLIVDHLASNGRKKHHWIQRFFWAITEGAVATALLS